MSHEHGRPDNGGVAQVPGRVAGPAPEGPGATGGADEGHLTSGDWEGIFDSLTDIVTIHDAQFNIVRANSSARRLLGLPLSGRLTSVKCFGSYHGTNRPPEDCPSCRCFETLEPSFSEFFEPHLNRHLELRAYPRLDPHGQWIGLVHVVRDISARVLAENERREREARYRAILRTAMDGYWTVDPQGRLLEVNDSYCRMSGYTEQELLTRRISDLEAAESDDGTAAHIARTLAAGEDRFETRHRRKDGTLFDVDVSAQYRPDAGGQIVAFLKDITERRHAEAEHTKLEAQLQQAQKMESVGRLAGGVAHDFNNMLSVILGHAELALRLVSPDHPLHSDLATIRSAATRSADLTRQLLAFARKQTIAPRVLDLNAAVAGTLDMLRRLIGENIHLAWVPGPNPWSVRMDPSQLDQILANLCVNARDAIASNGTITVATSNQSLDEVDCATLPGLVPGDHVCLEISDDGCGMNAETLLHVFEPFFTTKGVGEGTGLGLASVYGAVKQNGGCITARSTPGSGARFRIHLPRAREEASPPESDDAAIPLLGGEETILLADDEPAILSLATAVLARHGYTVLAASTPGEAIRLATEYGGRIHLLMTDVVMPEMSGQVLASRLLSFRPDVRCLFMSGYTAEVIAHHGVLDQGLNFLRKPFSSDELAAAVSLALGRG